MLKVNLEEDTSCELETLVKNHLTILSSFYPSLAAILSECPEYALRHALD